MYLRRLEVSNSDTAINNYDAGIHKIIFDGKDLPGGVYIYRLYAKSKETGSFFTDTKKMILSK